MGFDLAPFAQPRAEDKPAAFWAWNGQMNEENIRAGLAMLHDGGFGAAFVHARPGLVNEYLSEEWFRLWGCALKEAKRLGMGLHIYDENTYPSGYAGGHVMAELPDCAARGARVWRVESGKALRTLLEDPLTPEECREPLRLYRMVREGGMDRLAGDITGRPLEEAYGLEGGFCVLLRQQPYASGWYGGFPAPDLLRPEVTRRFLAVTHEQYARRFGADFGGTVGAAFSDEPGISPGGVDLEDPMAFPYSEFLGREFAARNGYSLENNMACLVLDIPATPGGVAAEKLRFDYYTTLRALWVESFLRPVAGWCRAHNLKWTGHFFDEHWPYPWGVASPSVMSLYEYMDWPGIDMLMTHMLKKDGASPLLVSVKELASAGAQLGKQRLLCEAFGAGGWDAGSEDFKRIGDWLVAGGVNLLVPHITYASMEGARKYDCPQSFDQNQPWWRDWSDLAAYYARLSALLRQGQNPARVLVLHPTTTWFLQAPGCRRGDLLNGFDKLPLDSPVKTYLALLQAMEDRHIPYHLGDELLLQSHGRVRNGRLWVGACEYQAVVLPPQAQNLLASTLALLEGALAAGVPVWAGETLPAFVDGEPRKIDLPGARHSEDIPAALEGYARLKSTGGRVYFHERRSEGQRVLFLCNSGPDHAECHIPSVGPDACWLDAATGQASPALPDKAGGLALGLSPGGSALLLTGVPAKPARRQPPADRAAPGGPVPLALQGVERLGPNVLRLDTCDLHLAGRIYPDLDCLYAADLVYQAHGFAGNPWQGAVQYKRRLLDSGPFGPGSGFAAEYRFWSDGATGALQLAAERPGLCRASVNGQPVAWTGQSWLGDTFALADITALVRPGENLVRIEAGPFDVRMELQPVYILGDFAVHIRQGRFILGAAGPLTYGALPGQGLPFYSGGVAWRYSARLQAEPGRAVLRPAMHTAVSLRAEVNGRDAGPLCLAKDGAFEVGHLLREGTNTLCLHLGCGLKNTLGPHLTPQPVRGQAWPGAWRQGPKIGVPRAEEYDFIGYGMIGPPHLLLY